MGSFIHSSALFLLQRLRRFPINRMASPPPPPSGVIHLFSLCTNLSHCSQKRRLDNNNTWHVVDCVWVSLSMLSWGSQPERIINAAFKEGDMLMRKTKLDWQLITWCHFPATGYPACFCRIVSLTGTLSKCSPPSPLTCPFLPSLACDR